MANPKIQQINKASRASVVIEDSRIGTVEWIVRPLPAYDLLSNIDKFSSLSKDTKDVDTENLSEEQANRLKEQLIPLMDVVLPACVIDPPITKEDADPRLKTEEALHVRDLNFKTMIGLFNKITELSGLDEASEEARKKLASQSSVKA